MRDYYEDTYWDNDMRADRSGPLRISYREGKLCVIGKGWLIPVYDTDEAMQVLEQISEPSEPISPGEVKKI